tara:strand:+ start:11544 stop:11753 length:210 start_codon:yes stop_codon:yes gene_type:complete
MGLPQKTPVRRTTNVNIKPIGVAAFAIIAAIGVFVTRYIILMRVIKKYTPRLSQADGTCKYIIFTISPC